jgi:putative DNA primase/helicase
MVLASTIFEVTMYQSTNISAISGKELPSSVNGADLIRHLIDEGDQEKIVQSNPLNGFETEDALQGADAPQAFGQADSTFDSKSSGGCDSMNNHNNDASASGPNAPDSSQKNFATQLPVPDEKCLYGLIGEIAKAGSGHTEANAHAIALNAMIWVGCAVGRGPFFPIGDVRHHARMFGLHVGRTSRGRKGEAVSLIRKIEEAVRGQSPKLAPQVHSGGLSSGEGLAALIHDGYSDTKNEFAEVEDKRLWVIESEFVNVLTQKTRQGNTLSPTLRQLWDGGTIKPAIKSNPVSATNPHVALSGAITPDELRSSFKGQDYSNGFANRFIMIFAERSKREALPPPTQKAEVDRLAARLIEVLNFVKADQWDQRDHMEMSLSQQAASDYEALYNGELDQNDFTPRLNGLLERRAPMLIRIAMIFALTDRTTIIEAHHVEAAMCWIRYWTESLRAIFDVPADEFEPLTSAQKIRNFLTQHGPQTRTEISSGCFHKKLPGPKLEAALNELLLADPPVITVESIPRSDGRGSPTTMYALATAPERSQSSE